MKALTIALALFDYDACSASDPMGVVALPLEKLLSGTAFDGWLLVQPCDGCRKAKGELHVRASLAPLQALVLATGASLAVSTGPVGMGWDMLPGGRAVDVDTSCVAVSSAGRVLLDEPVYFVDLISSNGAIRHTGDEREGDADLNAGGDDEIIFVDLARVPPKVRVFLSTSRACRPRYSGARAEWTSPRRERAIECGPHAEVITRRPLGAIADRRSVMPRVSGFGEAAAGLERL